ncbi:MAG: methyltransferase domain-containing protein [Gammaproteobacteria bacterium]|nr:methyltransferase domain-containing protein [Gammaproteobacteria bacterium]MBI5616426.1 methyltransferase domain-containing protein [Gammaproteobacteria bacterium]
MSSSKRFDEAYYARFYEHPDTRVADMAYYKDLTAFIAAYARVLQQPIARVLDVGCGRGQFQRLLAKAYPEAEFTGIEVSEYACRKYGWVQTSILDFSADEPFDLVICHDVLQYLDAKEAALAIERLAALSRGMLYLSVLTREDFDENCDQERTDTDVHIRSAAWYRRNLKPHFKNAGGGVWLSRRADLVIYALDALG